MFTTEIIEQVFRFISFKFPLLETLTVINVTTAFVEVMSVLSLLKNLNSLILPIETFRHDIPSVFFPGLKKLSIRSLDHYYDDDFLDSIGKIKSFSVRQENV